MVRDVSSPGECWVITTYFNPQHYASRRRNFEVFRDHLNSQGIHFGVAEAVSLEHPFALRNDDADIVMQMHSPHALWQKESLLNALLKKLPSSCDAVAWVDADICFRNDDWGNQVCDGLAKFAVLQPFSTVIQTPEGWKPSTPDRWKDLSNAESGQSTASYLAGVSDIRPELFRGHPGYAVAARRDVIDATGFYDRMILGGGDSLFLGACYGLNMEQNPYITKNGPLMAADAQPWCDQVFGIVQGNVGFLTGTIAHLWHGDRMNRYYGERHVLLKDFDPQRDLCQTSDELWQWSPEADAALVRSVSEYFAARNEDGMTSPDSNALRLLTAERMQSR